MQKDVKIKYNQYNNKIYKEKGKHYNMRLVMDTKRRKTKREFIGSTTNPSAILFDDIDFIGYTSN